MLSIKMTMHTRHDTKNEVSTWASNVLLYCTWGASYVYIIHKKRIISLLLPYCCVLENIISVNSFFYEYFLLWFFVVVFWAKLLNWAFFLIFINQTKSKIYKRKSYQLNGRNKGMLKTKYLEREHMKLVLLSFSV